MNITGCMNETSCLISGSVNDESFKTALTHATTAELITVTKIMDASNKQDDKLRFRACREELYRRERNREILFKAKAITNGQWVFGNLIRTGNGSAYIITPCRDLEEGVTWVMVHSATICQYTGLTDKNNKKIWEGDICQNSSREDIVRILWGDNHQWAVEICKTTYDMTKWMVFPLWQYDNCPKNRYEKLEVIGNIFDNPELIKEDAI